MLYRLGLLIVTVCAILSKDELAEYLTGWTGPHGETVRLHGAADALHGWILIASGTYSNYRFFSEAIQYSGHRLQITPGWSSKQYKGTHIYKDSSVRGFWHGYDPMYDRPRNLLELWGLLEGAACTDTAGRLLSSLSDEARFAGALIYAFPSPHGIFETAADRRCLAAFLARGGAGLRTQTARLVDVILYAYRRETTPTPESTAAVHSVATTKALKEQLTKLAWAPSNASRRSMLGLFIKGSSVADPRCALLLDMLAGDAGSEETGQDPPAPLQSRAPRAAPGTSPLSTAERLIEAEARASSGLRRFLEVLSDTRDRGDGYDQLEAREPLLSAFLAGWLESTQQYGAFLTALATQTYGTALHARFFATEYRIAPCHAKWLAKIDTQIPALPFIERIHRSSATNNRQRRHILPEELVMVFVATITYRPSALVHDFAQLPAAAAPLRRAFGLRAPPSALLVRMHPVWAELVHAALGTRPLRFTAEHLLRVLQYIAGDVPPASAADADALFAAATDAPLLTRLRAVVQRLVPQDLRVGYEVLASTTSADNGPVNGTPADTAAVNGLHAAGTFTDGTPTDGTALESMHEDGTPKDETPNEKAPEAAISEEIHITIVRGENNESMSRLRLLLGKGGCEVLQEPLSSVTTLRSARTVAACAATLEGVRLARLFSEGNVVKVDDPRAFFCMEHYGLVGGYVRICSYETAVLNTRRVWLLKKIAYNHMESALEMPWLLRRSLARTPSPLVARCAWLFAIFNAPGGTTFTRWKAHVKALYAQDAAAAETIGWLAAVVATQQQHQTNTPRNAIPVALAPQLLAGAVHLRSTSGVLTIARGTCLGCLIGQLAAGGEHENYGTSPFLILQIIDSATTAPRDRAKLFLLFLLGQAPAAACTVDLAECLPVAYRRVLAVYYAAQELLPQRGSAAFLDRVERLHALLPSSDVLATALLECLYQVVVSEDDWARLYWRLLALLKCALEALGKDLKLAELHDKSVHCEYSAYLQSVANSQAYFSTCAQPHALCASVWWGVESVPGPYAQGHYLPSGPQGGWGWEWGAAGGCGSAAAYAEPAASAFAVAPAPLSAQYARYDPSYSGQYWPGTDSAYSGSTRRSSPAGLQAPLQTPLSQGIAQPLPESAPQSQHAPQYALCYVQDLQGQLYQYVLAGDEAHAGEKDEPATYQQLLIENPQQRQALHGFQHHPQRRTPEMNSPAPQNIRYIPVSEEQPDSIL